jgi:DHA2 family multidrug resistance protein
MTTDVSNGYFAFTMIFRSIGMALLTVPLTTLAVSTLEQKDIPQGAALNNMMRQLGGSFGISIFDTYVTRRAAVHRTDLITHIAAGDPQVIERLNNMTTYFQSKGSTSFTAHNQAIGMLNAQVVQQTSILSYLDAYYLLGSLFIFAMPLLIFVKTKKTLSTGTVMSDH